jgi:hypothetical protein
MKLWNNKNKIKMNKKNPQEPNKMILEDWIEDDGGWAE